jgi:hypothetical protein
VALGELGSEPGRAADDIKCHPTTSGSSHLLEGVSLGVSM